jgi:SSS family solute:Na+ symporter
MVRVGRIATGVVVILGMVWIPMMGRISVHYTLICKVCNPTWHHQLLPYFCWVCFFKRLNAKGRLFGYVTVCLGLIKLTLEHFKKI